MGMDRPRVLLSEASSLTAREFVTVLGQAGIDVEVVSASSLPIARFSRWCKAVHRVQAPSTDATGYLHAVDALMASGRFVALLPTHEQAWLFAVGGHLLPNSPVAVASAEAFDRVESKVAFARAIDEVGLVQPAWHSVQREEDLDVLGFPVWVKAAFSTAGRGVRNARDHAQALAAWRELSAEAIGEVMVQAPASGRYAQVQGLFDHGRLFAAAVSEQLAIGAGGSAAARLSVDHPLAVDALSRFGAHLEWHGGLDLDYFHRDGAPQFIECNPRITEPGNAAAAGVNLPRLMIALATGDERLPETPAITRPGVRTRSTLAIAIGAAERVGTRRAIVAAIGRAVSRRPPLQSSTEVLTPVVADPPSLIPLLIAAASVLARPSNVTKLAGDIVRSYGSQRTRSRPSSRRPNATRRTSQSPGRYESAVQHECHPGAPARLAPQDHALTHWRHSRQRTSVSTPLLSETVGHAGPGQRRAGAVNRADRARSSSTPQAVTSAECAQAGFRGTDSRLVQQDGSGR